jgi:hypothetical protein
MRALYDGVTSETHGTINPIGGVNEEALQQEKEGDKTIKNGRIGIVKRTEHSSETSIQEIGG